MATFAFMDRFPVIDYGGTQNGSGSGMASPWTISGTFNFGSGDVDPNRRIAVAIAYKSTNAISAVDIDGISCTQVAAADNSPTRAEIWVADVPDGTANDVTITGHDSGSGDAMIVSTFSLYYTDSGTPTGTYTDTTDPFSGSVTTSTDLGSVVLGVSGTFDDIINYAWSGLTGVVGSTVSLSGTDFVGHFATASDVLGGSRSVGASPFPTGGPFAVAVASWS